MTIESSAASKSKDIPKPAFPSPRRRSSVAQAAAANQDHTADVTTPAPVPAAGEWRSDESADEAIQQGTPAPSLTDDGVLEKAVPPPAARERGRARGSSAARPSPTAVANAPKRPAASKDILLSLPEDAKERMVNTITWTQPHTGIGQQQKFIRKAISDLCDRLERDFNSGQPFPAPARIEE